MNGWLSMMGRAKRLGVALAWLAFPALSCAEEVEAPPTPSLELLEFLAEWSADEQAWLDMQEAPVFEPEPTGSQWETWHDE